MPAHIRTAHRQRLEASFTRAEATIRQLQWDAAVQSDLARYLCVLASGHIEAYVEDVLNDYATTWGDSRLQVAIASRLEMMRNPKANEILRVLSEFDPEWQRKFREYLDSEIQVKTAIDSLVNNKNKIAHGDEVTVRYTVVKDWFVSCQRGLTFLEGLCQHP